MTTYAYDKNLLGKAQITLASMMDCAVNMYGFELKHFYTLFLNSEISGNFARGDSATVAGRSGRELAYSIISENYPDIEIKCSYETTERSREYWVGWVLAYYQWYRGISFERINDIADISKIEEMYKVFHEMDITQFADRLDADIPKENSGALLKRLRAYAGLSQKELALKSDIPLKTIQQYEQGQKNIAHARADSILRLCRILYCNPDDLLGQS